MPTGYTYKINDGADNYEFSDYVWDCARNFGGLMHMRDSESDAKVTIPEGSIEYYEKKIQSSMEEAYDLERMSRKECGIAAENDKVIEIIRCENLIRAAFQAEQRYEDMLYEVEMWAPPTKEHVGLKEFMKDQIVKSMRSDCDVGYYRKRIKELQDRTEDDWMSNKINSCKEDLDRYKKMIKDENERIEKNREWIEDLDKSVPIPEDKKGW